MTKPRPLKLVPNSAQIAKAFEGDQFNRTNVAKNLDRIIARLRNTSGVLLIDGRWGEGKTWFARHWHKYLGTNHKTAYIDAFAHDYIDDPFLLIAGEISKIIQSEDPASAPDFLEKGVAVLKKIGPGTTKLIVNVVGLAAGGIPNTGELIDGAIEKVADQLSDAAEKEVEKKLKSFGNETSEISNFKAQLTKFTQAQTQPVIIIIDELDRCKPTFAVKLLERIKHFFDVPNLIFVLFTNREQLEMSINGVYGQIDAGAYLHKFVDLSLSLPKDVGQGIPKKHIQKYVIHLLQAFDLGSPASIPARFEEPVSFWASVFDFTLRDVERLFTLMVLDDNGEWLHLKAYLGALKIKHDKVFKGLLIKNPAAHRDAQNLLNGFRGVMTKDTDERDNWAALLLFHGAAVQNFKDLSQESITAVRRFGSLDTFTYVCHQVDLLDDN